MGKTAVNSSRSSLDLLKKKKRVSAGHRVRTGYGKPGKSWNLGISTFRPRKSWKIKVLFDKSVTADDKARTMQDRGSN